MSILAIAPADLNNADTTTFPTALPDLEPEVYYATVVADAQGVYHIEPRAIIVPQGFSGQIVWTIDESVADPVSFATVAPILFTETPDFPGDLTAKLGPGSGPVTSISLGWRNNEERFNRKTFSYYVFLTIPNVPYPVRVDPTVENQPPG
jgi:hypothetical protein